MRCFLAPAVLVVAALQACVGDSPTGSPGGDAGTDGGASGLLDGSTPATRALNLTITPVEIVRGQPATFIATLEWTGAPADVTLTVVGPPGTSSSGPVTVPSTATTQTFTLGTEASLAYGDQNIQVTATTAGLSAVQATASLFVRGAPGSLDTSFGDAGRATPPAGEPLIGAIGADSNGRFYATGQTPAGVVVARYDADGHLDSSFATNGMGNCPAPAGMEIGSFLYPWTAQRAGTAYEVAYGFLGGPGSTRYPMLLTQPEQGACVVSPTPTPAAIPSGDGIPQAGGLIWVANSVDGVVRYDAQGAVDPDWAGGKYLIAPPEAAAATDFSFRVVSASPSRLLLRGRATQGATDLWQGYALLDRATGQQVSRFASTANAKLGIGTAGDGTSYFFLEGASFLRIAADGSQTNLTSSFGVVAEDAASVYGTIAFTPDDSPILLLTNSKTQLERVVLLDKNLAATQPTVNLEAPTVTNDSMYAGGAIVDSKRRIIVLHGYNDDADDPSIVSVHWMIRRYWL